MAYRARDGQPDAPLTIDEYEGLPDEHAYSLELVRGYVVREPRPGGLHGALTTRLAVLLDGPVRRAGGASVLTEAGFVLSVDPPTVRAPDLAIVSHDRLPAGAIPVGLVEAVPDLAVEVASPANSNEQLARKAAEYLEAGTRIVCVIDPELVEATVYRSGADPHALTSGHTLDASDVVPGLRVAVSDIFAP